MRRLILLLALLILSTKGMKTVPTSYRLDVPFVWQGPAGLCFLGSTAMALKYYDQGLDYQRL